MTTPYAKLLLQRNGGALESGGVVAAHGDVVQLRAESKVGWGYPVALWELYDFPDGYALPAGWTLNPTTGAYHFSGNEDPPTFTLPASTALWGKFMPRLYILGGTQSTYRDSSTGIKILSPAGLHDVARYETDQFGGYVNELQKDLRLLATGGGVTPSNTDPVDVFEPGGGVSPGTSLEYSRADHVHELSASALAGPFTSIALSSFASIGGTPATTGALRLQANGAIRYWAPTPAVDVDAILVDASGNVIVGDSSDAVSVTEEVKTAGYWRVRVNGAERAKIDENGAGNGRINLSGDGTFSTTGHTVINSAGGGTVYIQTAGATKIQMNSAGVGLNGAAPVAPPAYTVTNHTTDRALNETADTLAQVANVLGTLINDLKANGTLS